MADIVQSWKFYSQFERIGILSASSEDDNRIRYVDVCGRSREPPDDELYPEHSEFFFYRRSIINGSINFRYKFFSYSFVTHATNCFFEFTDEFVVLDCEIFGMYLVILKPRQTNPELIVHHMRNRFTRTFQLILPSLSRPGFTGSWSEISNGTENTLHLLWDARRSDGAAERREVAGAKFQLRNLGDSDTLEPTWITARFRIPGFFECLHCTTTSTAFTMRGKSLDVIYRKDTGDWSKLDHPVGPKDQEETYAEELSDGLFELHDKIRSKVHFFAGGIWSPYLEYRVLCFRSTMEPDYEKMEDSAGEEIGIYRIRCQPETLESLSFRALIRTYPSVMNLSSETLLEIGVPDRMVNLIKRHQRNNEINSS